MSGCLTVFDVFHPVDCPCCKDGPAIPRHCHSFGCPHCEWRKGARKFRDWIPVVKAMERPRTITLTTLSLESIGESDVDLLKADFRRLRQRALFKAYIDGGLYALECPHSTQLKKCPRCSSPRSQLEVHHDHRGVTCSNCRYSSRGWHPHIHIIFEGAFFPWRELGRAWSEINCRSFPRERKPWRCLDKECGHVHWDGQDRPDCEKCGNHTRIIWIERADEGMVEDVCKYPIKVGALVKHPPLLREFVAAFSGKRLSDSFGSCRKALKAHKDARAKKDFACDHGFKHERIGKTSRFSDYYLDVKDSEWRATPAAVERLLNNSASPFVFDTS